MSDIIIKSLDQTANKLAEMNQECAKLRAQLKAALASQDDIGKQVLWQALEIEKLKAQLEWVTKERDEARAKWDDTISEIWTSDLQGQVAKARAQRDRAMELIEECRTPDKAHEGPCHPDAGCDSMCSNSAAWVADYMDLEKEIAAEKEGSK